MAFPSARSLFYCFSLLSTLVTMNPSVQVDAREIASHHVIRVKSLLPGDVCVTSKDMHHSGLRVVSRHGPCSPNKRSTTHAQILKRDEDRIDWIRSKIAGTSKEARPSEFSSATHIPAIKGDSFYTDGYLVTVGFGTPSQRQTVIFDTGSSITWVQCQPCAGYCYRQKERIFNPIKSSTYSNISCSSPYCSPPELLQHGCYRYESRCIYGVSYGDGSFSQGYYATETLSVASADTIPNFRFGCGQVNDGSFGEAAGLMGLGRGQASLVLQAGSKYGGVFSYCLPSTSSSTGYLAFGSGSVPAGVQYTPMLTYGSTQFYFLELVSISVGGTKLAISPTVLPSARTIIDSGTTITRLPPSAYAALRDEFRARMSRNATAPSLSGFDTCYDLRGHSTVTVPTVALEFRGVTVDLAPHGILYPINASLTCLAFRPTGDDSDVGILGNVQQRTFGVVYDIPKQMIGFGPKGCN